jgi:hypothetical protein
MPLGGEIISTLGEMPSGVTAARSGFEIDYCLERGRLLDRQIGGPSRFAAGAAGFLLLSQSGEWPEDTGSRIERRSWFPERQCEGDREYLR